MELKSCFFLYLSIIVMYQLKIIRSDISIQPEFEPHQIDWSPSKVIEKGEPSYQTSFVPVINFKENFEELIPHFLSSYESDEQSARDKIQNFDSNLPPQNSFQDQFSLPSHEYISQMKPVQMPTQYEKPSAPYTVKTNHQSTHPPTMHHYPGSAQSHPDAMHHSGSTQYHAGNMQSHPSTMHSYLGSMHSSPGSHQSAMHSPSRSMHSSPGSLPSAMHSYPGSIHSSPGSHASNKSAPGSKSPSPAKKQPNVDVTESNILLTAGFFIAAIILQALGEDVQWAQPIYLRRKRRSEDVEYQQQHIFKLKKSISDFNIKFDEDDEPSGGYISRVKLNKQMAPEKSMQTFLKRMKSSLKAFEKKCENTFTCNDSNFSKLYAGRRKEIPQ